MPEYGAETVPRLSPPRALCCRGAFPEAFQSFSGLPGHPNIALSEGGRTGTRHSRVPEKGQATEKCILRWQVA